MAQVHQPVDEARVGCVQRAARARGGLFGRGFGVCAIDLHEPFGPDLSLATKSKWMLPSSFSHFGSKRAVNMVPLEVPAGREDWRRQEPTIVVSVTRDGYSGRWVTIILVLPVNRKRPSSKFRRGGEAEGDENNAAYLPPAERLIGKEARASDGNERRPGEDAG